jgi:uncharacterized protein YjiS (DUF1127 family)
MTSAIMNTVVRTPSMRKLVEAIAPTPGRFDPLGLVSGYRAYLVHARLDAMDDAQLSAIGLTRADVPRAAMEAVLEARD